ncbi:Thiamine pyrophosphate protein domain protein TPP-binding protein [Nitrospina gracilis 3/211]|uniref:Thiamine pyrophosphate protein domain protein TPP-binding protein n=1 Tax=Nitrospina gracilis (strain 3/211) TaxID=1266370 RepID=M1YX62_NITG3|nr:MULTISPECIES: acetolactate synthase large subunit [Nitrospina]MCF8723212.1 acetolactate synthase-1/2/3 large subunit [Nitrospina sp. Nb-3]CCQ90258.1 Thiamine pyrophosphate protein domain protein TPP-binding protein [Nitrospina gracilis 3/211]
MKASDLFVRSLEQEGVEAIFGVPGEETLNLMESLRHSNIQFILTRHEQAAGFMAATYGRLTGRVGVCLSTLGPGVTNLVTAGAYAQLGAMPMLMISGQKPIKKSKQGRFQIVDAIAMMRPLTKSTRQVVHGNSIPVIVRESVRLAQEERPGAVHIELPEDIAEEECASQPYPVQAVRRPHADELAIEQAAGMLMQAKRPLVLIGAGANRYRTSQALKQFVDHTGIYFFNTQMGKGVVDERHPKFLGTAALSHKDYLHCAIEQADLILNVGHDVIEKPPFFMHASGATQVIHVNFFSSNVDEVYFPQLDVVGDIADSIERLREQVSPAAHWDFSFFEKVKQELEQHIEEKAAQQRFPVGPEYLVGEIRHIMPDDGILALDNGLYKIWFARNYKAYGLNTLLLDNALASMGAGLPSAMAARMVFPDRKVMAICGDGGFMMNAQELETAVRLKLDLVVVVLCDNAYGMIKWKQTGLGFPAFGMDYTNPDFCQFAEAHGATGHRVKRAEELSKVLKECLDTPGLHLVEVPIDYSEDEKDLIEEIKTKTAALQK